MHKIIHSDCLDAMRKMEDNSIDFIVTDPPYGLHFMGKNWDGRVPAIELWAEALRVCKPGSMLAAFGGSRTHHHLMLAIEGAGWEIRDVIMWIYGSGFPKSHNKFGLDGYGTALKPAYEPVLICKKPYEISHLFVTILLDLTEEIHQFQKSNCSVSDVDVNFKDSLAILNKVQSSIAREPVKTYAWEKLSDVEHVIKNITFLNVELKEKIDQVKDIFVQENAKVSGKNNPLDQKILLGQEECIFVGIQDIVTFVTKGHTEQNIGLLWKYILVGIFQGVSKFTTRTVINLITELRILKSCLHPTISNDTGNFSPSYEPIIIAMKPLDGTFAQNAEKWGIGGINIDGCRIEGNKRSPGFVNCESGMGYNGGISGKNFKDWDNTQGRWPANLILSEKSAEELDKMTGVLKSGSLNKGHKQGSNSKIFQTSNQNKIINQNYGNDSGGASRFFYCAKASSSERNKGLDEMPDGQITDGRKAVSDRPYLRKETIRKNTHPTVKPIALMKYIITLLAPPGNPVCLDPFMGSGSTGVACQELGINFIGIEKEKEYVEIAEKRINNSETIIQLSLM